MQCRQIDRHRRCSRERRGSSSSRFEAEGDGRAGENSLWEVRECGCSAVGGCYGHVRWTVGFADLKCVR
jgi:hypothetical protein